MSSPSLSAHDSFVLDTVLSSGGSASFLNSYIDPTLPDSLPGISTSDLQDLRNEELKAIRPLNVESPSVSLVQAALDNLTTIVSAHPDYASAYNNRAQTLRLLVGDDLYSEAVVGSTLWSDLCTAVRLASPSTPNSKVSIFNGSVLAAAHTQRGYLLWMVVRSYDVTRLRLLPGELRKLTLSEMEELVSQEFELGGRYGNKDAQELARLTNPYAKLCGEIVKNSMTQEMEKLSATHSGRNTHQNGGH